MHQEWSKIILLNKNRHLNPIEKIPKFSLGDEEEEEEDSELLDNEFNINKLEEEDDKNVRKESKETNYTSNHSSFNDKKYLSFDIQDNQNENEEKKMKIIDVLINYTNNKVIN